MRHRTKGLALSLAGALVLLAGCSGSDETAETAPTPGTAAVESTAMDTTASEDVTIITTTVDADPATSSEPPTTPVSAAPDTTEVPAEPFLRDVPGRLVDSAPNVDGPGEIYELMPKLWLFIPSELDPDDPNVIPPTPEDADILAAYAIHSGGLRAIDAVADPARAF